MTQKLIDRLSIVQRAKAPIPKFFKILKIVGLSLVAASGTIFAAPVALPAIVTTIAGYVAVAGTAITAVSQVTVEGEAEEPAQTQE
ncbi:MAG: hypothetical protein J7497_13530 [Chitinophagaceae bacterium]|nr:hypothetical protein [Chitinophagaceae bacterium]